jgi:hypothetical protein
LGLIKECKNCTGKEITNIFDFLVEQGCAQRLQQDPIYRRRYYVTALIGVAMETVFEHHNIYDSERRKLFSLLMERSDVYFKGCFTAEQYHKDRRPLRSATKNCQNIRRPP